MSEASKPFADSSLWEICAYAPSGYLLNANWIVTLAKSPLLWCSNIYPQHRRAPACLSQWLPSPSLNAPSHLSLSIYLSRTIMLDKSGIIHFGKWRRAPLKSLSVCNIYSQGNVWAVRLLLKSGKKTNAPWRLCFATVGWMQQQQQRHQKEKPTPRVSIDSTAKLVLFCESRRQCSNRLEHKRYVAWCYAA